ncbi:PspC domain-containing protein [Herpetosiphon sp. NSE202]|uniref:PspC domain-containing protein n=1 Tax=Herpetosiphon sp. NSE202 TaxID=3351349 RepID=UPI00363512AA
MSNQSRPLVRPTQGRVMAGVCAGLANYFGIDPTVVRVALVIFTLFGGSGILAYLIGWAVMPDYTGRRAGAPIIIALLLFGIPFMCFLISLPFQLLFGGN